MLDLPDELQEHFREELHQHEEEKRMPYVTSVERLAKAEGLLEGLHTGLVEMLESKFGSSGCRLAPSIRRIQDVEQARVLLKDIKHMEAIEEFRKRLKELQRPLP